MAVRRGALRAVLAAHLQASQNRLLRQLGANGLVLLVISVTLLVIGLILPILFGLSAAAYFLARAAFAVDGASELGGLIGLFLTLLAVGGGLIGGIAGGAKQLSWEQYRGYPLRPRTLFWAELLAGLGDAITLIQVSAVLGVCLATAIAAPHLAPVLALLAVESVLLLLGVQLLVGAFAERLVRRLRLALAGSVALAFLGGQLLSSRGRLAVGSAGARSLGEKLLELGGYLPASQALRAAHLGQWGGLGSGALLLGGVLLLSYVVVVRERSAAQVESGGQPEALWSYRSPVLAIARLQLATLLGSHLGKFVFAMPLITLILIRGPFSELAGTQRWLVPGSFIYLSLAANGLGFNQFGLDGSGVKTLFLLPISERAILQGKQLGFALWQAMQAGLLAALLLLGRSTRPDELLAGLMLFVCYSCAQGAVGQWTSIWLPRRMSIKSAQLPLPVVLIGLGTTVLCGGLFGGAFWALSLFARPLLLPGMIAAALAAFVLSRPLLGLNAGLLARHRERVVQAVG